MPIPQDLCIAFCALNPDFMTVRVDDPNMALAAIGCQVRYYKGQLAVPRNTMQGSAKILIAQRHMLTRKIGLQLIKTLIERDWVLVHEFDDHVDLFPEDMRNRFYAGFGLDSFRACHGVQTTMPTLAEYFGGMNPNVRAFPNQIFRYPLTSKPTSSKVRILFAAINRRDAWTPLMPHFNKVLAGRDDIEFQVMGDREFFEALETPHKRFSKSQVYSDYMTCMHRSDIILMPLVASPFNACKSDVKFLEAGICGVAAIASPTVYENTIKHGETGLIAHSAEDWEQSLRTLIEQPALRQRLADGANRYVRENRMLMQHIHKRVEWYHELWAKRHEINKRILADFPEIA